MKPTQRDYYYSDTYAETGTVLQASPHERGGEVILERTIFVPQGGGQPADQGTIGPARVLHVEASKVVPGLIVHYVDTLEGLAEGTTVRLEIDGARRRLHSRMHTAGHLIAALTEQIVPEAKASGGHHWPGEGRVEFLLEAALPPQLESRLQTALLDAIRADQAVRRSAGPDGERYVQIGDYPALRCGGTHCGHLRGIGAVNLRGIKLKGGRLRVGYDIALICQPEYEP